jgi:U3 small nucleolar RNA-associated protein 20
MPLAQLKVNLRPLWSPAGGALASLSQRFGDLVWRLLFQELQSLQKGEQLDATPQWMEDGQDTEENANDPWEEERSWRDPTAHKFRSVIVRWVDDAYAQAELVKVSCNHVSLFLT